MTPDQKSLAMWGGSALGIVLIGWGILSMRSGVLATERADVAKLESELKQTWLPNDPKGAQSYAADLTDRAKRQEAALVKASSAVAPPISADYRATDLTTAASRVRTDLVALRQRSQRSNIALPAGLPYESGLDSDEQVRALQLIGLCTLRRTLELCLDAGVVRVVSVQPGKPFTDPTGDYAVFPIELEVEASPDASSALFQGFLAAHSRGLGLRGVTIEGGRTAKELTQRIRFTATLMTANEAEWQLKPEPIPKTGTTGRTPAPAAKTGLGSRPTGAK